MTQGGEKMCGRDKTSKLKRNREVDCERERKTKEVLKAHFTFIDTSSPSVRLFFPCLPPVNTFSLKKTEQTEGGATQSVSRRNQAEPVGQLSVSFSATGNMQTNH